MEMTYSDFYKLEKVLKKHKISCFVDPNRWENKDGYVLYFHKITHAKKTIEYFTKMAVETFDILPNVLNAYFKYILVIKRNQTFSGLIKDE